MRFRRPRTMLSLILSGLGLVSLPLLIGIANAVFTLGELADTSEAVVSQSADSTLENQRLIALLTDMERNALQYLVLDDEGLLEIYASDHEALLTNLALLSTRPQGPDTQTQIDSLRESALAIHAQLVNGASEPSREALATIFRRMNVTARNLASGMRIVTNEQLNTLQADTRDAQRALFWQTAALVPGTAVLVVFFILLIGRPMRQIDRAIRELGSGDFSHPIQVTGPADIEQLGRQLEWLRDRLRESTEEKNRFLRRMSHELKTPLANIREGTDLLLDGAVGRLDRQQQEVTGILQENGVKLQKLIENLLTFSAWQARTESLDLAEFELKPLVFSVLSQHRLVISNRKLKLQIGIGPLTIRADQGKLRLVLENLISNAIKFTPDTGTIHVNATMDGPELVIDVADSGPGVAPEDGARIFEAFYQGRRLQGGPVGGTGIGLSVVAECVQAHGGSVQLVESSPYVGAHFQVRFPLRREADRQALAANA